MPGKKIFGRKRHLLVDTQGLILAVLVHAANIGDRDGARLLLRTLVGRFPRLIHLFADHGYTGPLLDWIKALFGWDTETLPEGSAQRRLSGPTSSLESRAHVRLVDPLPPFSPRL